MDLRTGTTRTRIAHLPEVIVLVAVDDMILRHVLRPVFGGLVVTRDILLRRTLEHRHIQILGIQLQHIHQVFPRHVDGAFLKVVAEAPVAKHLEHRVVVGVVAHFLQVVVLTRHTQTFLCIGTATRLRLTGS